jgi:hypothetical protein
LIGSQDGITGAVDDDPSGIATYTQTGAKFGYGNILHFSPGIICGSF